MDVHGYIESVAAEGKRLADIAEQGDLGVTIAPCPGWNMRELVRHLGMIHLWAAANLAFPTPGEDIDIVEVHELVSYWPELAAYPEDADLVSWYRTTHANLLRVLRTAPADVDAFTFLPAPTPLTMWARRQASEIAIHRFDAESARGITSHFDAAFAADMLDELISGFAVRSLRMDVDRPQVVHVRTEDTNNDWFVTVDAEGATVSNVGTNADLTLAGAAADLYLLLWNRTPNAEVTTTGNADLLDLWHINFRVRWS